MTNEEVIKLLDREVGMAIISQDENSDGDLYISEAKLKKAEQVLDEIIALRDSLAMQKQRLIDEIKKVGRHKDCFYQELEEKIIKDCNINIPHNFYLIGKGITFMNNVIRGGEIKGF